MPFYEYECGACGKTHEALQKVHDAPLKKCPSCGQLRLRKLVSAPIFRLKGSGWYETDFKSDQENKRNLAVEKDDAAKKDAAAGDKTAADKGASTKPEAAKADGAKADAAKPDTAKPDGAKSGAASKPVAGKRAAASRSAPKTKRAAARRSRR